MFNNEDNKVIYTSPMNFEGRMFYQFDIFVTEEHYVTICEWLSKEGATFYVYQPMSDKGEGKLDDDIFENGPGWIWLFIEGEDHATHFRLAHEEASGV